MKVYKRSVLQWEQNHLSGVGALRARLRTNNKTKTANCVLAYKCLNLLEECRSKGSRRLKDLNQKWYRLTLANYESTSAYIGQIMAINQELWDLHPTAAFMECQVI